MICKLCPRQCNVERTASLSSSGNLGFCRMGSAPVAARAALHFGEEPCISGTKGSATVFFSGCNLRCVFCQNEKISHRNYGKEITVERLREIYGELIRQGAHNLNLVNPTHFLPAVVSSLSPKPSVPVVINSSGYESSESLKALEGLADVYLPDFKYAYSDLARRYSKAEDYPQRAMEAIKEMHRQQPRPEFDENGMMVKGVMIRHLILPGQLENTFEVIDRVRDGFPKGSVYLSLMAQYTPCGDLKDYPELNRTLTEEEYRRAVDYLLYSGIETGFYQERDCASKDYIPDFSLQGIL